MAAGAQAWLPLLGEPGGGWCAVAGMADTPAGESARSVAECGCFGAPSELHRDRALSAESRDGARPRRWSRHSAAGTLLLAAGFAPRYQSRPLEDAALSPARDAVQRLLDAHDPYPGVVIDRCWNIVGVNAAASALTAGLPAELLGPPVNVYRLSLHPDGLAARTLNCAEWAGYLLHQLQRSIVLTGDPALAAIDEEVRGYPGVAAAATARRTPPDASSRLVPFVLDAGRGRRLSMFTTLTTFGTPLDVTLSELAVELFYPADVESAGLLRGE